LTTANTTEPVTATPPAAPVYDVHKELDRVIASANAPEWLVAQRREALEIYEAAALPIRASHLWRYTDPALFLPEQAPKFKTPAPGGRPVKIAATLTHSEDRKALAGTVRCIDGTVREIDLDDDVTGVGVRVLDLTAAANEMPDLVREHLGSLIAPTFGKFEALANALWNGGVLIYIPKGVRITKPIQIASRLEAVGGEYLFQRLLVIVEDDAGLTLVDEYGDDNGAQRAATRSSAIVELIVGAQARVTYATVQNYGRRVVANMTQRARIAANTRLETVLTTLGGRIAKVDSGTILDGTGAESNIFGLAVGTQQQQFDHHTVHDHSASSTMSDLKFKVAGRDRANSIYTGLIRIDEGAQFCEAYQENRNLILSSGARAETIPELEIMNNEVRCSHGATVGKVDPEEIFYLESRGIERRDAIRLIVSGFVGPILDQVPEPVRARLRDVVLERLGETDND
jgi:Fe-S cluster assembly protein SufD